jgi:uncharacterized protein with ParB-like and HNH nuclease domain/predicted transport protein
MKAEGANLLRVLKKTDQFIVPLYQRRYSWGEVEWTQLWEDLLRVADDTGGTAEHFVGSIVEIGSVATASHNPLQLIDGQQRLTTLSLLLIALARTAQRRLDVDAADSDAKAIANENLIGYYLIDGREEGDRRYKLIPGEADRATYLALLEEKPLPDKPARAILDAYGFFIRGLEHSGRSLPAVHAAISRLFVVDIALEHGRDDPQLIFESLNSTGLDLSQADLIRNFILLQLPYAEQEDLYRHFWRPIEERLAPLGVEGFDRFVRDYLTMRSGQIPKIDHIYRAFKAYAKSTGESARDIADGLNRYSMYYEQIQLGNAPDLAVRNALRDIADLKIDVASPFLLDVFDDVDRGVITTDELVMVIRITESYVFRRSVVGAGTNALNKIFAALPREIDEERYIESLTAALLLKEGSGRFPRDAEFCRELETKDIYAFRNRTYLLDRLENEGRKERVDVAAYTIEHVMPQNPDLSPEWQDELGPDWERIQSELLHCIGNLTLTGYNSELSDRPFSEKCLTSGGFNDSPLQLNESVRRVDRWDENAIQQRAAELAKVATRIWRLPSLSPDVLDTYRQARQRARDTYTLSDHPNLKGEMVVLFDELARRVVNLAPDVTREVRKQYVAFRAGRVFLSVIVNASELKCYLAGISPDVIVDPDNLTRDVRGVGHWGIGNIECRVSTPGEIDGVMALIEQALPGPDDLSVNDDDYAMQAVERVIERALTLDDQHALRRLVGTATDGGLYPRPWKRAVTLCPPQNRNVTLVTFRTTEDDRIEIGYSPENWAMYAQVSQDRVRGAFGWANVAFRPMESAQEVDRITNTLQQLLSEAAFHSESD